MRSDIEVGLLALVVTVVATPFAVRLLMRLEILDEPSYRSAHKVPIPRGGGIACLIGIACALGVAAHLGINNKLILLTDAATFAALGLSDDVSGISVRNRLLGQVGLAGVVSVWALHAFSSNAALTLLACLIGSVWIVAYVNVFNFMDGLNGLAGLAAVIAGVTFALIGYHRGDSTFAIAGAALAGTAAGFLPWNFPTSRVFLGDVGSYLLGSFTAILIIFGWRAHVPLECLIGPVALFVADTASTLASRIAKREDWTASHKQHVYQRLHQAGWSHQQTTLLLGAAMMVCAGLGSLSLSSSTSLRIFGDVLVVLVLSAYLASPRFVAHAKRSAA
jgi:UDP-N-acetylmuramyl pentapeptide phosphotransferase/UDP-N-acetylglucosamine-1-phosphate transferase